MLNKLRFSRKLFPLWINVLICSAQLQTAESSAWGMHKSFWMVL